MFYSHEVLTSRKYGVATVWLVATLGSKSALKKVSRKAILDVDVQKACETIVTPEAPMALRLQSNLLYGVTRVYSQQWGYMLHDAESAKNSMRQLLRALHSRTLDAEEENRGRTEQLVLPDDPNFLPDLDLLPLHLDEMDIDLTTVEETQNSSLSPHTSQRSRSSIGTRSQIDLGGLIIPPSGSSSMGGPAGGFGSFNVRGDSSAGTRMNIGGLDDDLGLAIDEDGTLRMAEEVQREPSGPALRGERTDGGRVSSRGGSEGGIGGGGGGGHDMLGQPDPDEFIPVQDDDYMPALDLDQPPPPPPSMASAPAQQQQEETSEETAEAPLRRRARPVLKIVPLDDRMELRNSDLARWNAEYVANMNDASRQKNAKRATFIAKSNAEFWILGQHDNGPLSIFSGARLLEALTGIRVAGHKRPRDPADEPEEDRHVRPRSEPPFEEMARGVADDEYMPFMGDDTIEQGREAATPLEERPSSNIMPWNLSAASGRPTGLFSAGGGFPTSMGSFGGGAGSDQQRGGPLSRRTSRLTSASPLLGRGTGAMDIDDFQLPDAGGEIDMTSAAGVDEFEAFGPAAQVDTQTAEQSQWQRAALDGESGHFLEFIKTGIADMDARRERLEPGEEEDEALRGSIDFDVLLPPANHGHIVAAQALLHVLALGTNNLITVQQDEAYGRMTLRVGGSL